MSPAKKTMLGIASFLPVALGICYIIVLLLNMRSMMLAQIQQPDNEPAVAFAYFGHFLSAVLYMLLPAMLLHFALMIIYIIQAVRNRAISETERVIWILGFVLLGTIAYPVYFFMRIYGIKDEAVLVT